MNETNPAYRAEAEAMDDALPKATGADAEGMDRFRGCLYDRNTLNRSISASHSRVNARSRGGRPPT